MIKFRNLKNNEIKTAYSSRDDGEKIYIKFTSGGKEYGYFKNNIEIIDAKDDKLPFIVYSFSKQCYKCHKATKILTYITYADKHNENATFPWDLDRLLKHQNIFAHLQDPSIEYYGLNVIGDIEEFDIMLMEKYPDKIQNRYSQTIKRTYPMNICEHCGTGQGWYFIYKGINEQIQAMKEIEKFEE